MSFELRAVDKALKFLQSNQGQKFTAHEIAQELFKRYPEECRQKKERSKAKVTPLDSDEALVQQIAAEINATTLGKLPDIKMTDERPRLYYFSTVSDEDEVRNAETAVPVAQAKDEKTYSESDLYPKLADYLKAELHLYSKRIDEKRSHNSQGENGNRWLFPDLVGFEDLSAKWDPEIKSCVEKVGDSRAKLWSFEVKKLLNRSNVRQAYFQAVSNSSWANLGYLVAAEIHNSEEELRILSGLHGIGVIRIDPNDPAKNIIMIPAKERPNVDWNVANRLAEENTDFLNYIKAIRDFHATGRTRKEDWS